MPSLVRERLFLGNISDAAAALNPSDPKDSTTTTLTTTHILSLLSSASISFFSEWKPSLHIPTEEIETAYVNGEESPKRSLAPQRVFYVREKAGEELGIERMAVPLKDTEDEDLLDYLEVCLGFIERGREEGAVLVHCFAGVSRSAAVITAYIMKTEQKSLEDALESLKEVCPHVCPNDGFLDQLKMFEEMDFKVDTSSPIYKRFRLKILGHSYKEGRKLSSSIFEADPGLASPLKSSNEKQTAYRCKKCRRVVALKENVVSHVAREKETCFEWNNRKKERERGNEDDQDCSSLFLEPLKWMTSVEEGALEGKLNCIHCDARLGYFNWSGIQCSCGSWITPAFQIVKSKVDISTT